jgi:ADP-heptose:LPS heptosyltransferase
MWLVNTTGNTIETCDQDLKKWMYFKPNIPINIEDPFKAIEYKRRYSQLKEVNNPDDYFINQKFKHMIVRDAGIGDLLLLEPIIRQIRINNQNREISVLTRYPEVYENSKYIDILHHAENKHSMSGLKSGDYEQWDDLRSYSETSRNRHKTHRTDIYNEYFPKLQVEDKEPKLYFPPSEKILLKKKKGYRYIGVSVDASHNMRKYDNEAGLIDYILKADTKNIVVLFGESAPENAIKHRRIMDLRGKTTIREMINYVRGLDYVVAVDSGIMHIALTLHIKTLCIFTIITPELRLKYYTGGYRVVTAGVDCIGCGDWHMLNCKKTLAQQGHVPCQDIEPKQIYDEMMLIEDGKPIKEIQSINIIPHSEKKLTMPIIVQNEAKNLPRFIENVINHPVIGEVIAIDGGSTDNTVELLEKAGAKVFTHPYIKTYHDQQAMQRNISCSYVADGTNILIMDIDECFSQELSDYLPVLANTVTINYGLISRRTFEYYKDITDPNKQIKDYPDWQPRFYIWDRKYKFVGGAHHQTLNVPQGTNIKKDIIHFECEGKDRDALEKQWSTMMTGVKQYA